MKTLSGLIIIVLCMMLLSACNPKISRLKKQQFDILKGNVVELLGERYKVKRIRIKNEEYCDDDPTIYVVEFGFDLAHPHDSILSFDIPGKFVFEKNDDGVWECTFNSGNPKMLRTVLKIKEEEDENR